MTAVPSPIDAFMILVAAASEGGFGHRRTFGIRDAVEPPEQNAVDACRAAWLDKRPRR